LGVGMMDWGCEVVVEEEDGLGVGMMEWGWWSGDGDDGLGMGVGMMDWEWG